MQYCLQFELSDPHNLVLHPGEEGARRNASLNYAESWPCSRNSVDVITRSLIHYEVKELTQIITFEVTCSSSTRVSIKICADDLRIRRHGSDMRSEKDERLI